ncbi:hypothetical protein SSP24_00050 [Streptomyces spinoverrucosus]|uniref:Uncharacterized protein n=1 Tax=Streptomyces spinoverrucosus TaxID=284043 RepID=A0A4Y3V989_9ACTN|nr:hypothetical protein SSP24_00050 [Streptomyces spinoverrucosus]GHB43606.1 hypothetical protein GCM10010397_12540 [Streptomyces spinoverrucosus]
MTRVPRARFRSQVRIVRSSWTGTAWTAARTRTRRPSGVFVCCNALASRSLVTGFRIPVGLPRKVAIGPQETKIFCCRLTMPGSIRAMKSAALGAAKLLLPARPRGASFPG